MKDEPSTRKTWSPFATGRELAVMVIWIEGKFGTEEIRASGGKSYGGGVGRRLDKGQT